MQTNQNKLKIDQDFLNHQNLKIAEDILSSQVENEAIFLHIPAGMYYSLSETSLLFWQALEKQQPLEPVIDKITTEYEVERSQVISELEVFLQELLNCGMIYQNSDV
jgi:hypothetical protein